MRAAVLQPQPQAGGEAEALLWLQLCDVLLPGALHDARCSLLSAMACRLELRGVCQLWDRIVTIVPWCNPQEHQLEHWKLAEGGHRAECRRLNAQREAAEAEAAAELARLSLGVASSGPTASSRVSCGGRSGGSAATPQQCGGTGSGAGALRGQSGAEASSRADAAAGGSRQGSSALQVDDLD